MKLSEKEIRKLQSSGAKVRRKPKPPPPKPVPREMAIPAPPQVNVTTPEMPNYGEELRTLISTLDNRLNRTRRPWRIKVNRDRTGFAESYDVIPLEGE